MEEPSQLQKLAIEAARQAGEFIRQHYGKIGSEAIQEKEKNDFVTLVDRGSEAIIIDHIRAAFPNHSILAEESGATGNNNDYCWIIDPLDGTTNFIKNIPIFAVSIAVLCGNESLTGVVYNPILDEMFSATKGGGACLNQTGIHVSPTSDFSQAFIATGFPHHVPRRIPAYFNAFSEIFFYSAGARRLGSAALDLCYTACGTFDAFWETGLNPWDVAAGALILRESGGLISDFQGGPDYLYSGFLAAGNPPVHKKLVNMLSTHFKDINKGPVMDLKKDVNNA